MLLLLGSTRAFTHCSTIARLPLRNRLASLGAVRCQASLPDSEEGWRTVLSPNQFAVLRNAATEPPGYSEKVEGELEYTLKNEYKTKYPSDGAYACVGCGSPLYYARTKFNSGCGWPAFYDGIPGAIEEKPDPDGSRIEIVCNACKGHLGHVFKGEGFPSPTDERHCVNGICLKYDPASQQPEDVKAIPGMTPGQIPD
jgi:peptide-methionine (R)-S-oxide reductase|eukprot:Transcript_14035.p2 GENE.Transcript_14035~~Transcript_14035.p2  ORF type:complete len:198 (-),score=57.42 Transcript_14035:291-884(-)